MSTTLWVVAWVLAVAFFMSGMMKITQSKEKLAPKMAWVEGVSEAQIKGIGLAEVLGAIGVVVPGLAGVATVLVPLAATGLGLVMVGAMITHARLKENSQIVVNVVLFALAAFVAWGRFGPHKF